MDNRMDIEPDISVKLTDSASPLNSTNQDLEFQSDEIRSPHLTLKEAFILTSNISNLNSDCSDDITASENIDPPRTEDLEVPDSTINTGNDVHLNENNEDTVQTDDIMKTEACENITIVNCYEWTPKAPYLLSYSDKEFQRSFPKNTSENYLRGCSWAPDGSCILTNSKDNIMRLFNLPSSIYNSEVPDSNTEPEVMTSVLCMRDNELVNDYCWYPGMNSSDPATCCFASTSRRNPIRLWDAFTGLIRATYRPINHLGELASAYSIAFSADGQRLYAGFNRYVQVFDTCRPGCDSVRRPKLGRKPVQGGIISCINVLKDPSRSVYATGSYNGTVCIFSEPGNLITRLQAHPPGVTQVAFSGSLGFEHGAPWYLLAGGRMDSRIFVWDARNWASPVCVLHRRIENHQRFQFDLDPYYRYLFTGSQTGVVCIYDLADSILHSNDNRKPVLTWRAHSDCSHGLSVHPNLPIVATTSGQRRIEPPKSVFKPSLKPTKQIEMNSPVTITSTTTITTATDFPAGDHLRRTSLTDDDDDDEDVNFNDEEETTLADEEALIMMPATEELDTNPSPLTLPLQGELTRLPRENRLNLWYFAQTPIESI